MDLKPGDYVVVIDENHAGKVIRINKDWVYFEDRDGFEYAYPKYQLIKKNKGEEAGFFTREKPLIVKKEKDKANQNHSRIQLSYDFSASKPIFDLHLEDLSPDLNFSNNHESLLFQLRCAEEIIEQAEVSGCRNLVFIHGVGKGKLRQELRRMLNEKYSYIEYLDASYQQFGFGATEIIIHVNRKIE